MIVFSTDNLRVTIVGAPDDWVRWLGHQLRYPSAASLMDEHGKPIMGQPGEWDGWVRLLHRPKASPPWAPAGLLPHVCWYAQQCGLAYQVLDTRVRPELDVPDPTVRIPLREAYQVPAVEALVQHGRGVISCPPRSGKTRILCEVQRRLGLRTLWVTPTDRIADQTHQVLEGWFGAHYSTRLVGGAGQGAAAWSKVVVSTYATASMLGDEFLATRECWVVDEVHHGASAQLRALGDRMPHVFYRLGATGTFFRSGTDGLALHALLSNVVYQVSAQELLDWGFLVPVQVAILPVPAPRVRGAAHSFHAGGHGTIGIHEHEFRNRLVVGACVLLAQRGRRVICLVGTKQQGRDLLTQLQRELPRPADPTRPTVDFVCSDSPPDRQRRALEQFQAGGLRVLVGTTLLGEGVDLPDADALVLARGEQAEVQLVQAIYRICTAASGKRQGVLVDFADGHHRKLEEHARARQAIYQSEPIFHVDRLVALEHLPLWLDSIGVPEIVGSVSGARAL